MASQVVRGRGRPAIYTGSFAKALVAVLAVHGLMRGQQFIRKTGVQPAVGQKKRRFKVSLPTLDKLARNAGLEFQRGRPKIAA